MKGLGWDSLLKKSTNFDGDWHPVGGDRVVPIYGYVSGSKFVGV